MNFEELTKRVESLENKCRKQSIVVYDESEDGVFDGAIYRLQCNDDIGPSFILRSSNDCKMEEIDTTNMKCVYMRVAATHKRIDKYVKNTAAFMWDLFNFAASGISFDKFDVIVTNDANCQSLYDDRLVIYIDKSNVTRYTIYKNGVDIGSGLQHKNNVVLRESIRSIINEYIGEITKDIPRDYVAEIDALTKSYNALKAERDIAVSELAELRSKIKSLLNV